MAALEKIEPKPVFYWFEQICSIPHGSGNVKKISDFLVSFAGERGLKYIQDDALNVIIYAPASEGCEDSSPLIIQGHMDMVCAKTDDCRIDFLNDPIQPYIDGDWVTAEGTSLGGDDGIAVAIALAVLDDKTIAHPLLECVFTVNEETGMDGAQALDFRNLKGRRLLNLDSEAEGMIIAGCAGGVRADCSFPLVREEYDGISCTLSIDGLKGGHSGEEIDKGRLNANKALGRILYTLNKNGLIKLASIEGGVVDNAIPVSAKAVFSASEEDLAIIKSLILAIGDHMKNEYASSDPGLRVLFEIGNREICEVAGKGSADALLFALFNLPNGVRAMSPDIKGLVQTSLNLGVIKSYEDRMVYTYSIRSSLASQKQLLCDELVSLTEFAGGTVSFRNPYPAWEFKRESAFRDTVAACCRRIYGKDPLITAIHGGLECGLFSEKAPDLDCVSLGPSMEGIHTPAERLNISSVQRIWTLVLDILKSCVEFPDKRPRLFVEKADK